MTTATKRRPKAHATEKPERLSIEESTAAMLVKAIDEDDTVPWSKGWTIDGIWPMNPVTGTIYKGINPMILGIMQAARNYQSPYWVTFKQMVAKGAKFNQDAKGTGVPVVYWNSMVKPDKDDPEKMKRFGFWRGYTVFNLDLIDGIELPPVEKRDPITLDEALITLREGYEGGPTIRHIPSAQAYYTPSLHQITLPTLEQFLSSLEYGHTLAHELCHSTGHEDLLKRNLVGWNCQQDYAKEELVAEIGAVMVLQMLGLDFNLQKSAEYVRGWRTAIHDDPKIIISAASKAFHAASMVTGFNQSTEEVAA
jgi:antirestriction protein ArdC